MLLRSAMSRRTLSDDAAAFVALQFWKHANGLIFWDLNYLHNALRQRAALKQKKTHWLLWFRGKIVKRCLASSNKLTSRKTQMG